jgi:adenosine kinase
VLTNKINLTYANRFFRNLWMSALICGSVAFDTIMVFNDKFQNHILPEQVHILNVSFLVPDMRREFGGCAGNIAYNLKLLGEEPVPMATVGMDFDHYAQWFAKHQINQQHLVKIPHTYTAQAFITTDLADNQITAFHPGAMNFSHTLSVNDAKNIKIAMVSPDGRDGMIEHANQLNYANIPFIFDPGQGMPLFDETDLLQFIEQAQWVILNDYEWQLLHGRTGLTPEAVAQRVSALIITKGAEGSLIYADDTCYFIPIAKTDVVNDPTGCGDAYRAGVLYGLLNDLDWQTTGRIAALMGAIKIEHHGTQNHHFSLSEFKQRFVNTYGFELNI